MVEQSIPNRKVEFPHFFPKKVMRSMKQHAVHARGTMKTTSGLGFFFTFYLFDVFFGSPYPLIHASPSTTKMNSINIYNQEQTY